MPTIPEDLFLDPGQTPEDNNTLGDYLPPAEKIRLLEAEIDQLEDELVEAKRLAAKKLIETTLKAKDKLNILMRNTDELILNMARLRLAYDKLKEEKYTAQMLIIQYLADLRYYKAHPWRLALDKIAEMMGRFLP